MAVTDAAPTTTDRTTSRLDHPSQQTHELQPFFTLTTTLLRAVRQHDFDTLAMLCDDDAGIVDVDPGGQSVMIRTRQEWEGWFHGLFGALDELGAETDSLVLDYRAFVDEALGWSVLEFRQFLELGDLVATFDCVATIIWKRTEDGWREARWHCSVLSQDVPDELMALAAGDPDALAA
ncbi:MAG: nuclear transport factor 2 family protein [Actinomycetota bacterium]